MTDFTAANTSVAVLERSKIEPKKSTSKTHLACSSAKPLWTSIEESIFGKRVESRLVKKNFPSVTYQSCVRKPDLKMTTIHAYKRFAERSA